MWSAGAASASTRAHVIGIRTVTVTAAGSPPTCRAAATSRTAPTRGHHVHRRQALLDQQGDLRRRARPPRSSPAARASPSAAVTPTPTSRSCGDATGAAARAQPQQERADVPRPTTTRDGRWVVNPMFIDPLPRKSGPYPCATDGYTGPDGSLGPVLRADGSVVPDQPDPRRATGFRAARRAPAPRRGPAASARRTGPRREDHRPGRRRHRARRRHRHRRRPARPRRRRPRVPHGAHCRAPRHPRTRPTRRAAPSPPPPRTRPRAVDQLNGITLPVLDGWQKSENVVDDDMLITHPAHLRLPRRLVACAGTARSSSRTVTGTDETSPEVIAKQDIKDAADASYDENAINQQHPSAASSRTSTRRPPDRRRRRARRLSRALEGRRPRRGPAVTSSPLVFPSSSRAPRPWSTVRFAVDAGPDAPPLSDMDQHRQEHPGGRRQRVRRRRRQQHRPPTAPTGRERVLAESSPEERAALAPVRRHGRRHPVALDQLQRVEPLAQLAGLRVPEPHLVADQQIVGGRRPSSGVCTSPGPSCGS